MARPGRVTNGHLHSTSLLPVIKGSQEVEPYDRERPIQGWLTPRLMPEVRTVSRIDYLEDRLQAQERTTQSLLDRAYKVKEDIIDSLNITHGTWQEEKQNRELLSDHIGTITNVVHKLSRDIAVLEEQLRNKSGASQFTQESVKNLEMHHVAGVTDLRGRVARCDASIAKLAADLKNCTDATKSGGLQQNDQSQRLHDKVAYLDTKIHDVTGKLDKIYAEHELQIRHMESDSSQKVITLDAKTKALIEDMKNSLRTYSGNEQTERERLEARLIGHMENVSRQQQDKLNNFEQKLVESINNMNRSIVGLEDSIQKEKERNQLAQQELEDKLNNTLQSHLKRQSEEVSKLKKECREGFTTVQETIINMKQVMDGKYRLLEEQIKREISSIRKMVVLI